MELTAETDKYVVIKGFIDAREHNSNQVYGAFVSASGYQNTLYLRETFTNDPIDRTLSWPDLLEMLSDKNAEPPVESTLAFYKEKFHNFANIQHLLEYGRGRMAPKDLERKVSYFCSTIGLSALTFLEMTTMSKEDLFILMPCLSEEQGQTEKKNEKNQEDNDSASEDDFTSAEEDDEGKEQDDIFLACEPVLDPISGTAISSLTVGDMIAVKLPEASSYYQFFTNKYPEFDGIIDGKVTGVKVNEYGAAVVALKLADGISGTLKLSEKVRIKRLLTGVPLHSSGSADFPAEIIFAGLGVAAFLIALAVLLHVVD